MGGDDDEMDADEAMRVAEKWKALAVIKGMPPGQLLTAKLNRRPSASESRFLNKFINEARNGTPGEREMA
eukprot:5505512-Prymnesium_polylepis.1